MNSIELYRRSAEEFDRRVRAVAPDQWSNSTPCSDWDVRALVNHLVYELRWAVPLMEGKTIEEVGDAYEGDLLGDDPSASWSGSFSNANRAIEAPGAGDRTVHLSYGDEAAKEYLLQLSLDALIHSWDLARATAGDDRLDQELVETFYRDLEPREDDLKQSGAYGPKVEPPEDGDTQTKLLAIVGRRG